MSYAVYTTEGFILGSTPSGEASKTYWIYTRDFGLIRAKAQGVRLLASKLRYVLDDYSFSIFSLVKGREVWRLTGAQEKKYLKESAAMRARILSLIRRLVQGEEQNEKLFSALMFTLCEEFKDLDREGRTALESLILVHVLSSLGYLDAQTITGSVEAISLDQIEILKSKKQEVIAHINKALKETQL